MMACPLFGPWFQKFADILRHVWYYVANILFEYGIGMFGFSN